MPPPDDDVDVPPTELELEGPGRELLGTLVDDDITTVPELACDEDVVAEDGAMTELLDNEAPLLDIIPTDELPATPELLDDAPDRAPTTQTPRLVSQ